MPREIKFMAWDQKDKIMDGPFSLEDMMTQNIPGEYIDCCHEFIKKDDIIFLQYTGIKDDNGKEIYEGDIVKIDSDIQHSFDIDVVAPVTYLRGQFYANKNCENLAGLSVLSDVDGITARCEVIGNIYENPGLLTK